MGYSIAVISLIAVLIYFIDYSDSKAVVKDNDFNISCIDGVEYWYGQSGYKGYMSPRIDPETLDFVRCDG